MNTRIKRRAFCCRTITAAGAAAVLNSRTATALQGPGDGEDAPTLDLHVHLFGLGDSNSGCRISSKITRGLQFKYLMATLGVGNVPSTDESYLSILVKQLKTSGLTKGLVLAQDAVYDAQGRVDWNRTHFYVPNDYLLRVVARHRDVMLPCVSINPNRVDAMDELQRCVERGARALKIHPPTQGVNLMEPKHSRFFQRCADLDVIVLVHTGHEHSAPVMDINLASPLRLRLALEQGCTVVACHSGTGWPGDQPDMLGEFLSMLSKYDKLWGDTAVLGSLGHAADFLRLLADRGAHGRLLHGSDFPFPCSPFAFQSVLSKEQIRAIGQVESDIARDLALKEALGIGRASAERAYSLVQGPNRGLGRLPHADVNSCRKWLYCPVWHRSPGGKCGVAGFVGWS